MEELKRLRLLKPFKGVFENMRINYDDLYHILWLKFTLDNRRTSVMELGKQTSEKKEKKTGRVAQHIMYVFFGIMLVPILLMTESIYLSMSLYATLILFFLLSSMISDYSTVLLDRRDQVMFLTRPIERKALSVARFLHIFSYVLVLLLELALPSVLVMGIRFGIIAGLGLFIMSVLMSLFSVVLTSCIYVLLLHFFNGEKLKDFINIFQVLFTVSITLGYQIVPRIMNISALTQVEFSMKLWHVVVPPMWFAAPLAILIEQEMQPALVAMSFLGIGVPTILLFFYVRWIAPRFEGYLSKMNESGADKDHGKSLRENLVYRLASFVSQTDTERAFVLFSRKILTKERETKLRMYPGLVFAIGFPVIFGIMNQYGGRVQIRGNQSILLYFYMTPIFLISMLVNIKYSESYRGAWIYKVAPFSKQNEMIRGVIKGFVISYVLPIYICMGIIFYIVSGLIGLVYWGILIGLAMILLSIHIFMLDTKYPFSEKFNPQNQKGKTLILFMLSSLISGIFVLAQVFLIKENTMLMVAAGGSVFTGYIAWKLALRRKI
jgi:hypothetical protein